MRKTFTAATTLAAALAVSSSFALADHHMPGEQNNAAKKTMDAAAGKPMLPPGVVEKPIEDRHDLTDLLGEVTNAAVTNNGFDDLIERLNDQDRNRLGEKGTTDDEQANAKLNGRIDQIRKAYKAKYGSELDLNEVSDKLFTDAQFIRGEVQDSSKLMANWPLPATGKKGDMKPSGPAGTVADAGTVTPTERTPAERANLENGRAIAVGMLPAKGDASGVTVSVVGEMTAWKLDIPNKISVDQLRSNLLAHLTKCGEMSAQWPADKSEADAVLARHILLGIYGVPVEADKVAAQ